MKISSTSVKTTPTSQPRDSHTGQSSNPHSNAPRLPSEHDESADSQAQATPGNQVVGKQAYDDLKNGLVDTDRGPVVNKLYDKVRAGKIAKPD